MKPLEPNQANSGRLLIVDDERQIVGALTELLAEHDYETTGCSSGEEALEALRANEYDVLLTDLMMPGMDGITLLRSALEIDPNLIGIVMTGQGTVQTVVEAMKLGAYDYLLKPCTLRELLPLLARCVEKRQLRIENQNLRESIAVRAQVEESLRASHDQLEARVVERTAELASTNEALQAQILERQTAMSELRATVAELERARLQADNATREADRANHAKSDFLSRMSHELRTPMNSILGFAQLLEMSTGDARQLAQIGHISKAGQHLLKLINEVLDLARVESGNLSLTLEPVAVANTVQMAVDLIRPLCREKELHIEHDGDSCSTIRVNADQQRLSQVVLNLLANATKYNRQAGEIRVVCANTAGDRVRVSVSDTGMGLSPEKMSKLFQPFERLGAEATATEGTGLGLALSKRLIEAMGGSLGADSVQGEGSTFWLELPSSSEQPPPIEETSTPAKPVGVAKACTLLYIEDNLQNLSLVEAVLKGYPNVRLLSAVHGRAGIDLACQHKPSLILLDLHLPDMQGDEVLRRLRADPVTQSIPVLVLSADATTHQIAHLKELGADDYLTKPINIARFMEVVNSLLE